ncbi:MucB/RseB C-terminal domain-containing protein [Variovorax sp.]|uniref:MucB/RseB C-terminal domain-containing protein n=1 Tax=Variovorax sp. TaxID=1871043 RepID=UPI002D760E7A|nr:MucB/RseB C-terminal domain-containing protein [Variovorax sp.]HYP84750.1 MucB/RseB C-terminal domain-containing protein [Variovorax sp.]
MSACVRCPAQSIFVALAAAAMLHGANAQEAPAPAAPQRQAAQPDAAAHQRGVIDWLRRMHEASRRVSYIGTFVVSAGGNDWSSARIWHACDAGGTTQVERVEALTGAPRTTFRRGEQVLTFLPERRIVRSEKRIDLDQFPSLSKPDEAIATYYDAKVVGEARVAGFDTDVVQLVPRDALRFGYRMWVERGSGLLTKLQTLDAAGRTVEQSAFSELELDAPVKVQALSQMMAKTDGYHLEAVDVERIDAAAEGWMLKQPVPGFREMHCFRRAANGQGARTVQWIFSDGLASVSLFVEPDDANSHRREGLLALGATYTLTRRLSGGGQDWWLTAVGEVPPQTLERFATSLERVPR